MVYSVAVIWHTALLLVDERPTVLGDTLSINKIENDPINISFGEKKSKNFEIMFKKC